MMNKLFVSSYFRSINHYGEELCGDKVEILFNNNSFVAVLADGLGSGVKANILATLTSKIISEMVIADFSIDEIVETISKTLPECRERKVAYCTFTIIQIFNHGLCRLVEFDNPETIILRNNQILELEKHEYSIGNRLIKEVAFESRADDIFVFFSDGVINASSTSVLNLNWNLSSIKDFLLKYTRKSDSVKEINRLLLANVFNLYQGIAQDDVTCCVLKVINKTKSCVMVGPPLDSSNDKETVRRLLECDGNKIVCGGTTSNIVARELAETITTDINQDDNSLPPISYIKGIDLVTEGVITLKKVNDLLKACLKDDDYKESLLNSKLENGAISMVKIFINDCSEILFLVGQANNTVHNSLTYTAINLESKLRLINEIATSLKSLGKIVMVEKN